MLERLIEAAQALDGIVFEPLGDYATRWRAEHPLADWLATGPEDAEHRHSAELTAGKRRDGAFGHLEYSGRERIEIAQRKPRAAVISRRDYGRRSPAGAAVRNPRPTSSSHGRDLAQNAPRPVTEA